MNTPLWQCYSVVVIYIVGAILSWVSPTFRKEIVVPTMVLSVTAQLTLGFLTAILIIAYRTFYQ